MEFLLFYGSSDGLNNFTDELVYQIEKLGGVGHIVDTRTVTHEELLRRLTPNLTAIICYDFIGTFLQTGREAVEVYDRLGIPVINILVDHPMNLLYGMKNPPAKYIQCSVDEHHVAYAKEYFHIENAFFLPHMASVKGMETGTCEKASKDIPILFSGNLISCNEKYNEILMLWGGAAQY